MKYNIQSSQLNAKEKSLKKICRNQKKNLHLLIFSKIGI